MFEHFLGAQAPVHDKVLAELQAGRKASHWMWFVFPQIAGLGYSDMARRYALASLAEAQAYLAHPLLGARLRAATEAVLAHAPADPADGPAALHAIFGSPDDVKFRSAMTLFARAAPDEPLFARALAAFCRGEEDPATLERL